MEMKQKRSSHELLIIGGGPAGLKAGEAAQNAGIDYIILERGEIAGAWKTLRPEMIMLSPCHPQRDWTSLSGNFPIWQMDVRRPFCTAEEFVAYLCAYAAHFKIQAATRAEVTAVKKENGLFSAETLRETYTAPFLLVATGFLSNPYIPDIPGFRQHPNVLHSHSFKEARSFRGKRVIVIGAGNSAAETALELCGEAQTYLYTRKQLRFFSKTKNLCHIRGISESLLLEMVKMNIIRYYPNSRLLGFENQILSTKTTRMKTDFVICATGYRPHIPMIQQLSLTYDNTKYYPEITEYGESDQISNLFFAGPLARFRLSSQFIHGFVKSVPKTVNEIGKRLRNIY
jgi:thioredoxin reductase (NADPH)